MTRRFFLVRKTRWNGSGAIYQNGEYWGRNKFLGRNQELHFWRIMSLMHVRNLSEEVK